MTYSLSQYDYWLCNMWKSNLDLMEVLFTACSHSEIKRSFIRHMFLSFCLFVPLFLSVFVSMFGFVSVFVFAIVLSPFWWRLRGPWLCIFVYLWSVVLKSFIVAWALWAGLAPWWESAAIATRLLTAQDHISISRSLGPTSIQPQPDASNNKSHLFDAPSRSRLMADLSIWKSRHCMPYR